jgi:hypothetical protein
VCCLLDYRDDYTTGIFALNITESLGVCDVNVQGTNTRDLFDTDNTGSLITGLLHGYSQSSVSLMAESGFRLSLGMNDLARNFSQRLDFEDGHYELKFFVGMAYHTLMNQPLVATAVSEVQITISVSPFLTFAFSSAQKYNFVEYLVMNIH